SRSVSSAGTTPTGSWSCWSPQRSPTSSSPSRPATWWADSNARRRFCDDSGSRSVDGPLRRPRAAGPAAGSDRRRSGRYTAGRVGGAGALPDLHLPPARPRTLVLRLLVKRAAVSTGGAAQQPQGCGDLLRPSPDPRPVSGARPAVSQPAHPNAGGGVD